MKLYLVRHAIAEVRDNQLWPDDANRPLSSKGVRSFRRAARGLEAIARAPEVVLSSPFVRAWDTSLILQDEAGWPHPQPCPQLTVDSPHDLLEVLHSYASAKSIALVGHEPQLKRFASILLAPSASSFVELRKGGAICIERADSEPATTGKLIWALPPRILRSLGE